MPMRDELTFTARTANTAPESDAWAIVGFCLTGLLMSLYFTATSVSLDDVPLLIAQYNVG